MMSSAPRQAGRPVQLAPAPTAIPDQLPSFSDYWRPVRRRWWLVGLCLILGGALAGGLTLVQPQEFEARASILLGMEAPRFLGDLEEDYRVNTGPRGRYQHQHYLKTQLHVIRSRPVMERVVDTLHLALDDDFLGGTIEEQREMTALDRRARAIEVLTGRTRVVPLEGSEMVSVVLWDYKADRAAELANSVIDRYIAYSLDLQASASRGALAWLDEQHEGLRSSVESAEEGLYAFRSKHQLLTTPLADRLNTVSQRVADLGIELTKAEVRRIGLAAEWSETKLLAETGDIQASPRLFSDATVQRLKAQLIELEQRQAEFGAALGAKNPKVLMLNAELAYARQRLQVEVQRVLEALRTQMRSAQAAERGLRERLNDQTRRAVKVSKLEIEYTSLARELENSRRLYDLVLERSKTIKLASLLETTNIRRHESAIAPKFPARPRVPLNVAFGILLGLFAGVGAAVGLDRLNHTVRDERELEELLGLRVLGEVPAVAAKDKSEDLGDYGADRIVSRAPRSAVAEAFRTLRTNLLFTRTSADLKSMVVTSAGVGEGKTSVSTNLALVLAAAGKRVLVIDTDMRRPRVHKVFELDNKNGLTNVLIAESSLDDAIVNIEERLDVLRCGPIPPNPSELLASPAFANLVAELRRRYDSLIFDSPPAGVVADASILSQLTDGVLLVVRAERTHRGRLAKAVRDLRAVGAEMLGTVVNNKDRAHHGYGYGYGYYSGYYSSYYSYGSSEEDE
jgi:capsular exopolysaccharide synthesis family protein